MGSENPKLSGNLEQPLQAYHYPTATVTSDLARVFSYHSSRVHTDNPSRGSGQGKRDPGHSILKASSNISNTDKNLQTISRDAVSGCRNLRRNLANLNQALLYIPVFAGFLKIQHQETSLVSVGLPLEPSTIQAGSS